MSTIGLTPAEFATAQLDGHPVAVRHQHRRWPVADYVPGSPESTVYEPVAVTLTAPVRLSLEDVAAVLFGIGCVDGEDLTDAATVRYLVADVVSNAGSLGVEELRCQLEGERTSLSAAETAYLAYCRDRAAAVFTPHLAGRSRPHELAAAAH